MSEKRYSAGLQDVNDRACYKDFFESNTYEETRQKADDEAEKYQRSAIVFDRERGNGIVYKKEIKREGDKEVKVVKPLVKPKKIEEAKPLPIKRGRGRPPKNEEVSKPEMAKPVFKPASKDDYF